MKSSEKISVELRNISKEYEKAPLLQDISLKIPYNSYFSICGPTGSGKSTLLRIIAGLEKQDQGDIFIDGKLMNNVLPEDRGVGMLFEHMTYALFPHLSIYENLIYGQRVRGMASEESEETANEMLRLLMLSDRAKDFPEAMSGGMKQRVALGRALMTGARLILLDEPLGALDAKIRLNLRKELVGMVKSLGNLTVIHITQDVEEALMVSDYIVALFAGKVLQIGTPEEIYNHPNSLEVCSFFSSSNFFEGEIEDLEDDIAVVNLQGSTVRVKTRSFSTGNQVVVAIRATDLSIQKEKTSDINQWDGIVLQHQFNQGIMRYQIELETKQMVIVNQPYNEKLTFKANEKVAVVFSPRNIFLFPHPGESLEKKIIK